MWPSSGRRAAPAKRSARRSGTRATAWAGERRTSRVPACSIGGAGTRSPALVGVRLVAAEEPHVRPIPQRQASATSRVRRGPLLHRDQVVLADDRDLDARDPQALGALDHGAEAGVEHESHPLAARMTELGAVTELARQPETGADQ